jgi:two-component system, cell cycle response regulator DivK
MAGEPILIIDDTPVNLKLTRILLANEGYEVRTAPDAEEALAILESFHPKLMLVDIQLPGIDGLELTRRVKAKAATSDIVVVALTAFAMKGDEQRAREAGCDGYITKPIDTRTLPGRVRDYLAMHRRGAAPTSAEPQAAEPFNLFGPEVEGLRQRFLSEGGSQARQLLDTLGSGFDSPLARKLMHQWVGAAGLLGYREISTLAREIEQLLAERPLDNALVREALTNLIYGFTNPPDAARRPVPPSITEAITGRRFALVGFSDSEAERMCAALSKAGGLPRLFPATELSESDSIRACDLVMVHVRADTLSSIWFGPHPPAQGKPLILVGERETLLGLDYTVQMRAREFLMDAWHPEEALMRACRCLQAPPEDGARPPVHARTFPPVRSRPQLLLADDDPIVLSLVRTTLLNYGMEVRTAANGAEAMEQLRLQPPDAAILDVNMPGMDGFELLAGIRQGNMPVRVILLTARQQESDVVRGFSLGCDDYVVKPFSPLELVARLKRLLAR